MIFVVDWESCGPGDFGPPDVDRRPFGRSATEFIE